MKKIIEADDIIGKTIKGIAYSCSIPQALLVFTDGSCYVIEGSPGYDPGDVNLDPGKLDLWNFGNEKLVASGLLTQAELDELYERKILVNQADSIRVQINMLDKKFKDFNETNQKYEQLILRQAELREELAQLEKKLSEE